MPYYSQALLMRSITTLLVFIISLGYYSAFTQTNSIINTLESSNRGEGKVKIIQNNEIEQLLEKHIWDQSKERGIMGYRIRIFSGSGQNSKSEFEETKAKFISNFDIPVHEVFDYPDLKIYVGDFRSRSEAKKVLKQVERIFPNNTFIVYTQIKFPNLISNE